MLWFSVAFAQTLPSEEVVVEAKDPPASAAERELDATRVVATPGRSTDDLLRATRGLHQSQHSGHGKAFQYFLRGFDAVHGADLSISAEGVPLNEVSNVHGHGYLDLHFIPRQLVTGASLRPGVFRASVGDFGVAGSGELSLGLANPGLQLQIGGGTDLSGRFTMAWRPADRGPGTFAMVDAEAGHGVGPSRKWEQVRAAVGIDGQIGNTAVRTFALAYRGRFDSPGVLRESDVDKGTRRFYDAYDNAGDGVSARALAGFRLEHRRNDWSLDSTAWAGWRSLELRQNFTGFYVNAEQGDAVVQTHEALSAGARLVIGWTPADWIAVRGGVDGRFDHADQTEAGIDTTGKVWDPRIDTRIDQSSMGAWVSVPLRPRPWFDLEAGLRTQVFLMDLDRRIDAGLGTGPAKASAPVLAPRARLRLFADSPVTVLLAYGRGFRSPEARGVEQGRAPVSKSDGTELSVLVRPDDHVDLRAGAFGTWISNEIVFDHAAARFLTTGATRRLGAYVGATVHPVAWLEVDLDVTASDGRYRATQELIPYAPRLLAVLGLTTEALVTGPVVWTAGTRTWWLGPRPLPGGFASHTQFVTDVTVSARVRSWTVDLDIDNVFASRWRDGEFFYASDFVGTDSPSALPARHFTAGSPFVARLGFGFRG